MSSSKKRPFPQKLQRALGHLLLGRGIARGHRGEGGGRISLTRILGKDGILGPLEFRIPNQCQNARRTVNLKKICTLGTPKKMQRCKWKEMNKNAKKDLRFFISYSFNEPDQHVLGSGCLWVWKMIEQNAFEPCWDLMTTNAEIFSRPALSSIPAWVSISL